MASLQSAERKRDALLGAAIGAWNKKAQRAQDEREESRRLIDEMIAESKAAEDEQRRRMEAAAPWQGAFSGGATGASIGSIFGPTGALIGAGIGALGGGIMGASSPDTLQRTQPYLGMAGQAATAYRGYQDQRDFSKAQQKTWEDYLSKIDGSAQQRQSLLGAYRGSGNAPRLSGNRQLRLKPIQ